MKAGPDTEMAISSLLKQFFDCVKEGDLDGVLNLFSPDADTTMIGLSARAKQYGPENIRSYFEKTNKDGLRTESYSYENLVVSESGSTAWASGDMDLKFLTGERLLDIYLRFTGVFENREGRWRVCQFHLSIPWEGSV